MKKPSKKLLDNGFTKKVGSILESIWKFIVSFRKIFIVWIVLTIFVAVGLALGLDKKAIAFLAIVAAGNQQQAGHEAPGEQENETLGHDPPPSFPRKNAANRSEAA